MNGPQNYNTINGPQNYNTVNGPQNYNAVVPSVSSSALGITFPGSATPGTAASYVNAANSNPYTYPGPANYPVTVGPGGSVTIVIQ